MKVNIIIEGLQLVLYKYKYVYNIIYIIEYSK